MFSDSYADPDQLKMLQKALQDHCQSKGIEENTPEYEAAAVLVIALFKAGVTSAEELSSSLAAH